MRKWLLTVSLLLSVMTLAAYEVIVFGDVHFDSEKVRESGIKLQAYQEREMRRNIRNGKNFPGLLRRAAAKVTPQTAFVIQLGDIVQGDCGKGEFHEKALNMVLGLFREAFPRLKVYLTTGNHDIRGDGAAEAYRKVVTPYLSRLLQKDLSPGKTLQYTLTQENDLFVFWNSNEPDIDFLEAAIAAHPERRHLFIVTHIPIIPVVKNDPSWTVFGRPDDPAQRKRLVRLLAKNNAIILCAHIHKTTYLRWQNEDGTIVQTTFFSIFPNDPKPFKMTERNAKAPFAPDANMKIAGEFLPGYREIKDIQPGAGFALLRSADDGVSVEFYNSKSPEPTCRLKLK